MIANKYYGRLRPAASLGSLPPFRTNVRSTVDDSLESFWAYVYWDSRARTVQRKAFINAVPSIQSLRQPAAM